MKRTALCLLFVLIWPAADTGLAAVPTMPTEDVRPGMKGIGRTVFSGQRIEQFGVEVIDVMHDVWPHGDMIICRLSGRNLETSGVVAGMSGSPVYVDGKLIGAIAYAWGFAKEPIAGVTPISQMLEVWDQERHEQGASGRSRLSAPPVPGTGFSPLPLPVAVSGLTQRLSEFITPSLQTYNLVPVAAAGKVSSSRTADSLLAPGAAVGVALTDGDVRLCAIGTLTWRDGDRVLAFGHPMFQAGKVELPLVAGVIHAVLPSVATSFKLFSPTDPVGTITQDRLYAVGGRIGPVASMTPVSVSLKSPTNRASYRFRVIKQDELAATLVAMGLADIVYRTEGTMDEVTLNLRLKVSLAGPVEQPGFRDSVNIEHILSGDDPAADMFKIVRDNLGLIFNNRFQPGVVSDIDLSLEFTRGREVAYLVSAQPDRRRARPGEAVRATLRFRDYRGQDWEKTIRVPVPPTTREGTLNIVIAPRDSFFALEAMRAPATTAPRSLARLVELLSETGRENELLVAGYARTGGLTVGERELPSAPASLRSVLLGTGTDEPVSSTAASLVLKQPLRLDRAVSGVAKFDLEVME